MSRSGGSDRTDTPDFPVEPGRPGQQEVPRGIAPIDMLFLTMPTRGNAKRARRLFTEAKAQCEDPHELAYVLRLEEIGLSLAAEAGRGRPGEGSQGSLGWEVI